MRISIRNKSRRDRSFILLMLLVLWAVAAPAQEKVALSRKVDAVVAEVERTARAGAERGEEVPACFIWEDMAVSVAPGITGEELRALIGQLPASGESPSGEKYVINAQQPRWTTTSTSGAVTPRMPFTLTYSFVPDGTQITLSSASGRSNLITAVNAQFPGGMTAFRARVGEALRAWGTKSGITYVEVSDDGAPSPGSPGVSGVRGDIRIGMFAFPSSIGGFLAFNFFPNSGDMVLDSGDLPGWFASPTNNFRRLRNTVSHEHGHGLGYSHVIPQTFTKLMEAVITDTYDGLLEDDVRGLQRQYGDWAEPNDTFETAKSLGSLPPPQGGLPIVYTMQNLALEDNGLFDCYAFSIPVSARLSVMVTPIGTSYQTGPVGGSANSVDALRVHDLAVDVLDANGVTVLASVNSSGAGGTESIANLYVPKREGSHRVVVRSVSGTDDVQRYELRLSYTAEPISTMELSTASLSARAIPDANASSQSFTVRNVGLGTLQYTVESDSAWLSPSPASGTSVSEADSITVIYSTATLAEGDYTGHLTVTAPDCTNSPQVITVSLKVAPPRIAVDQAVIRVIKSPGGNPSPVTFKLSNSGAGTLNYTLTEAAGWFGVSPGSGTATTEQDTITVTFDVAGFPLGRTNDVVRITSPGAANSPLDVPVEIIVTNHNGWTLQ